MFAEILRFWLDRGIGGFRVDMAHGLLKDPDLADAPGAPLLLALPGSAYIDQGGVTRPSRGRRHSERLAASRHGRVAQRLGTCSAGSTCLTGRLV